MQLFRVVSGRIISCRDIVFLFCYWGLTSFAWSGHPADGGMPEMEHPAQPLPENALLPTISFEIARDLMDGYNLRVTTTNFNVLAPLDGVFESVEEQGALLMQGHIHMYINGKKMMRIYGAEVHVPASWTNDGINSITLSINNHQHGTYTHVEKDIQSTVIIDSTSDRLVKTTYHWPEIPKQFVQAVVKK